MVRKRYKVAYFTAGYIKGYKAGTGSSLVGHVEADLIR